MPIIPVGAGDAEDLPKAESTPPPLSQAVSASVKEANIMIEAAIRFICPRVCIFAYLLLSEKTSKSFKDSLKLFLGKWFDLKEKIWLKFC